MATTQDFRFRQSISWDDAFKQLPDNPYIAAEIADSRDRNLEEWLSKHVVTTVNATGDVSIGTGQTLNVDGDQNVSGSLSVTGSISVPSGSFDSADITDLSVEKLTSGTFSAEVFTVGSSGQIKSSNYSAGSAGWSVDNNSAEFNDVTIRGTLSGADGTFAGNLTGSSMTLSGNLTVTGEVRTATTGDRMVFNDNTYSLGGTNYKGLAIYDGTSQAGGIFGTTNSSEQLLLRPPAATSTLNAFIGLRDSGTDATASVTLFGGGSAASSVIVDEDGVTVSNPLYFTNATLNDYIDHNGSTISFYINNIAELQVTNAGVFSDNRRYYFGNTAQNDYMSYNDATNTYSIVSDGVTRFYIVNGEMRGGNGGQTAPIYGFANATGGSATGMYYSQTFDEIRWTNGGAVRMIMDNTALKPASAAGIMLGTDGLYWGDINYNGVLDDKSDMAIKNLLPDEPMLGLDFLTSLKIHAFTKKDDPRQRHRYGVIAQEVKVALEAADIDTATTSIWRQGEGYPGDDEIEPTAPLQAVSYTELIPVLIRAIQELEERCAT